MGFDNPTYFALADNAHDAMVPQQPSRQPSTLDELISGQLGSGGPAAAQTWTSAQLEEKFKNWADNALTTHIESMDKLVQSNAKSLMVLPDNGVKAATQRDMAQAEQERRKMTSKQWLHQVWLTCKAISACTKEGARDDGPIYLLCRRTRIRRRPFGERSGGRMQMAM